MSRNSISAEEQKEIMLEMLRYVDNTCRENEINYSLIGGSLIGAIRHKGFIPWDDDIDIVLTSKNYEKLRNLLDENSGKYQILKDCDGGEHFGFTKLIDTGTGLMELDHPEIGKQYGIFIDIFCYYPTSNDQRERIAHYKKIKLLRSLIIRKQLDFKNYTLKQNLRWLCRSTIIKVLGYKRVKRMYERTMNKYNNKKTDYVVSNWPIYGFEKEIQLKKNTEEYIDAEFEGLKVMIFKNYDEILRTTFGDYMQLPPESERIPKHNMKAWWREGCENEAKKLRNRIRKEEKDGKAKR